MLKAVPALFSGTGGPTATSRRTRAVLTSLSGLEHDVGKLGLVSKSSRIARSLLASIESTASYLGQDCKLHCCVGIINHLMVYRW